MNTQGESYFSHSWALLTRERGWLKPILVLAAALLVPVAGFLGVWGYALEWARLTAWGVDSAPKQRDVRIGTCIASGWRALCACFGYAFVGGLLASLIMELLGSNSLTDLLYNLLIYVAGLIGSIAALRATIYQQISAGYRIKRIGEMIERDYGGLIHVALVSLLTQMVVGVLVGAIFMSVLIPFFVRLSIGLAGYDVADLAYGQTIDTQSMRYIVSQVLSGLGSIALPLAIAIYVGCVGTVMATLISQTALGLWMRQFDVAHWGASEDPLPFTAQASMDYDPYGYGQNPQQTPYGTAGQNPYAAQDPYMGYTQTPYGAEGQGQASFGMPVQTDYPVQQQDYPVHQQEMAGSPQQQVLYDQTAQGQPYYDVAGADAQGLETTTIIDVRQDEEPHAPIILPYEPQAVEEELPATTEDQPMLADEPREAWEPLSHEDLTVADAMEGEGEVIPEDRIAMEKADKSERDGEFKTIVETIDEVLTIDTSLGTPSDADGDAQDGSDAPDPEPTDGDMETPESPETSHDGPESEA